MICNSYFLRKSAIKIKCGSSAPSLLSAYDWVTLIFFKEAVAVTFQGKVLQKFIFTVQGEVTH